MGEDWLQMTDENINVEEIMRQIRERIARRNGISLPQGESPAEIADDLWKEMIGDAAEGKLASLRPRDCDIVPRTYTIDWRIPILGPIHAVVRRVINAEIRRYLSSSLEKQSHFNRQVLQVLKELAQENALLRQELAELQKEQK